MPYNKRGNMKTFLKAVLLVGLVSLVGCAEMGGKPSAAENDWAKFMMAGFNFGWGKTKDNISFEWKFILQVKKTDIRQIKIYDITESSETLLINDESVKLKSGNWLGSTPSEEIEKKSNHWIYSDADIKKKFKAILIDSKGQTRELIQRTNHPAKERRLMLMTLG